MYCNFVMPNGNVHDHVNVAAYIIICLWYANFFEFVFHKKRWQRSNKRKICFWWPTDPIKINWIILKCLEMPKVVHGLSWKFVCTLGMGQRTNLYNIGGDPLTQLNFCNYFIYYFFFFLQKKCWQWENERKIFCWWPTYAINRTFQQSSLSTALVAMLQFVKTTLLHLVIWRKLGL